MRLLVTRPAEDAAPLAALLEEKGHEVTLEPLLTIEPVDNAVLDFEGVQALLITSANGVRAFAERNAERDLPVLAVGDASASVARELGFTNVESATGDVAALARGGIAQADLAPLSAVASTGAATRSALQAPRYQA